MSRSPGLTVKISRSGGNFVDEVMGPLLLLSLARPGQAVPDRPVTVISDRGTHYRPPVAKDDAPSPPASIPQTMRLLSGFHETNPSTISDCTKKTRDAPSVSVSFTKPFEHASFSR
jgi:hypothetical protein